ncbi:MAG: hypothetical protein ABIG96_02510 [Candidatus Micrarchaeota archaeon]
MDLVYLMLLFLAGMSFLLNIEWLMLATIFLFFAILFSKYYSGFSTAPTTPPQVQQEMASTEQAKQQPQPIIVMNSGGSGGGATITDNIIATMMGNVMAMDVYEKQEAAPWSKFLSRGGKFRQNFMDHSGSVSLKDQAMGNTSKKLLDTLDKINKKLDSKD